MSIPDWSLILDNVIALAIVLAPLEFFILRNLVTFRRVVFSWLKDLYDPERRKALFADAAHGFLRAMSERAGSARGTAAKAEKAGLINAALSGGPGAIGALGALPGNIDLPVVGKVSIGQALQLFQTLKSLMGGGSPLAALAGESGSSSSAGMPP